MTYMKAHVLLFATIENTDDYSCLNIKQQIVYIQGLTFCIFQ